MCALDYIFILGAPPSASGALLTVLWMYYSIWAPQCVLWMYYSIWAPQCAIGHYLPCPGMNLYFGGTSMCALDVFIFGGTYDVPIRALLIYALV